MSQSTQRFANGTQVRIGQNLVIQDDRTQFIGQDFYIQGYVTGDRWPYRVSKELNGERFRWLFAESELELATPQKVNTILFKSYNVKLGDKVKITYKPVKAHWDAISDGPYRWQTAMDAKVGEEGRVVAIVDENSYRVRFADKSSFTFSPISVQVIDRAPISETVMLNSNYNGIVSIEGVVIDERRRYDFDVFERLLALINEQREAVNAARPVKEPVLHLKDGKPNLNQIAFDSLNLTVGDTVRIIADLQRTMPDIYTSRMARYLGESYTVVSVTEETGTVELSNGYTYPALALEFITRSIPVKSMVLGYSWTAEVHGTHVQVGCQRYEFDAFDRLMPVIEKFKALKAEFSE